MLFYDNRFLCYYFITYICSMYFIYLNNLSKYFQNNIPYVIKSISQMKHSSKRNKNEKIGWKRCYIYDFWIEAAAAAPKTSILFQEIWSWTSKSFCFVHSFISVWYSIMDIITKQWICMLPKKYAEIDWWVFVLLSHIVIVQ